MKITEEMIYALSRGALGTTRENATGSLFLLHDAYSICRALAPEWVDEDDMVPWFMGQIHASIKLDPKGFGGQRHWREEAIDSAADLFVRIACYELETRKQ